jgi:hypothetical protein
MKIPLVERLFVDCSNIGEAQVAKMQRQIAANEPASSHNDNQVALIEGLILFHDPFHIRNHPSLRFDVLRRGGTGRRSPAPAETGARLAPVGAPANGDS